MGTYELIAKRRSIRRFKQDKIEKNILEKMINAARLAPSAANMQPLEFIVVHEGNDLNKIFKCLKWANYIKPDGNPPKGEEPTAYVIVLINTQIRENGGHHDSGAAIENMLLTALEEGVGSCWICSIDRDMIGDILQIPIRYKIDSVIALGYPNEEPITEESDENTKYYKDQNGTLHVPKRPLAKVLHWDKF